MITPRKNRLRKYLTVLVLVTSTGCGGDSDALNSQANRPSREQLRKMLRARYAASENFSEEIEAIGGRIQLSVDFSNTTITDDDLGQLDFPKYLTKINLAGTEITDAGIKHLEAVKNLRELNLWQTRVTDACLDSVRQLPHLKWADLNGTEISHQQKLEMVGFFRQRRSLSKSHKP